MQNIHNSYNPNTIMIPYTVLWIILKHKFIRRLTGVCIYIYTKREVFCTELFRKFNTLPCANEFLLSALIFVVNIIVKFQTKSDMHNTRTKHRYNLHALSISK